MKVGDVIIALPEADEIYLITKGKNFKGEIVKKRSTKKSKVDWERDTIKVKVIKSERIRNIGDSYWVNEKYFELENNIIKKAEDF